MNWKETLRIFERTKQWEKAIEFMQEVIEKNPDSVDVYIAMNFLIMNLLVEEEDCDRSKREYYAMLAKKYFEESYEKFSNNAEYLYFVGRTAVMSEWYFGIEQKDRDEMIEQATRLDPGNPIYQWNYYSRLAKQNLEDERVVAYANQILDKRSSMNKILSSKGAVGEYVAHIMFSWAKRIIEKRPYH